MSTAKLRAAGGVLIGAGLCALLTLGVCAGTGLIDANSGDSLSERMAAFRRSSRATDLEQLRIVVLLASREHSVPAELLWSMMEVESRFNPNARSHKGAQGLMQLMPETARAMKVTNPYDPYQNIHGGARYLRLLLTRFGGREDLAVAAYNAGPSAVDKHRGVPPFPETRAYVRRVLGNRRSV